MGRGWLTDAQREALIDGLSAKMTAQERADFIWDKNTDTKYDQAFMEVVRGLGDGWVAASVEFDEEYLRDEALGMIKRLHDSMYRYGRSDFIVSHDGTVGAVVLRYRVSVMEESAAFRAVAEEEGLKVDDLRSIIDNAKLAAGETLERKVTRETTARAKAKPRTKDNPELRAARLQATYETLVRNSDLENPSLSLLERRRQAKHIDKTYYRLRELVPAYRDDSQQLRLAQRELSRGRSKRGRAARQG
jgi:hypothetical protein